MQTTDKTKEPARRRKQQRTVDTRQKIIGAALAEFALRSFDGASTRGIAEVAQVPHSLVLYHFKTKEDLWYETVRETVAVYARGAVEVAGDRNRGDTPMRLRRQLQRYIWFCAENPDFFRLLTHENALASERLTWFVEHHVKLVVTRTVELIERSQALGAFVQGDPLTLLYMFVGAATSPYRSAREIELLTGKRPDNAADIERHAALCDALFFRDPVTSAAPSALTPFTS